MVSYVTVRVHVGTNSVTVVFLQWSVHHRYLHSFPTRRSSDLPDGSPLDNNALGFAASTGALVTTSTLAYGVDGAAASGAKTYALVVTDGTFSGVRSEERRVGKECSGQRWRGRGTESRSVLKRVGA